MVIKYPCKIYNRPVAESHDCIQCDNCNVWVHRKCNKVNKQTYKFLQKDHKCKWYCIICTKDVLPFSNLNNEEFLYTVKGKKLKFTHVAPKHVSNKTAFLEAINSASKQDEKTLTKYCLQSELHQLTNKTNSLKILHLNISSLQYHFVELHTLLTTSEIQLDIIGISESRLKRNKHYTTNIDLPKYNIEHCDAEGTIEETLLYIKKDVAYKPRNDLKMYKNNYRESIFIEIINQQKKNIILGCVYRHPCMEVNEFYNDQFSYLSENL